MNKFYVYRHIRLDTGSTFYIGKGFGARAFRKSRNQYWKNIANKHGYTVEILQSNLTEKVALDLEIKLIAHYKLLGQCEANLTLGGDGISGFTFKHTPETKLKISKAGKGRIGFWKNKKLKDETKLKMSNVRFKHKIYQIPNIQFKNKANKKKLIYFDPNGTSYLSSYHAAKAWNIAPSTVRIWARTNKFKWSCKRLKEE